MTLAPSALPVDIGLQVSLHSSKSAPCCLQLEDIAIRRQAGYRAATSCGQ